jgi:hypothetical protein
MIGEIGNHLWQSTVFVAVAALLSLLLRSNGAHVRHAVWTRPPCTGSTGAWRQGVPPCRFA